LVTKLAGFRGATMWQAACSVFAMSIVPTHAVTSAPPTAGTPAVTPGGAAGSKSPDFTFHDFFSILNPLEHIPVISTLYRAISGDTINPPERIVGDTLYGGWMGLVSSLANLVYERETGKDFGDTVLAFVEDKTHMTMFAKSTPQSSSTVAANVTAKSPPAAADTTANPANGDSGVSALSTSLAGAGMDAALGQRAIYAYRRTMGLMTPSADLAPAY